MERRRFVLTSLVAALAGPLAAVAQQAGKSARIGRLSPLSAESDAPFMSAFRQGLPSLGWIEGPSFTLVSRFAEGKADRLPQLAASLVQDGVDVILSGSNPGALAAKNATTRIRTRRRSSSNGTGSRANWVFSCRSAARAPAVSSTGRSPR